MSDTSPDSSDGINVKNENDLFSSSKLGIILQGRVYNFIKYYDIYCQNTIPGQTWDQLMYIYIFLMIKTPIFFSISFTSGHDGVG